MAACFRLVSPLKIPQEEKRVSDGHGRSFGSWPWQKGCLMVMADPSDHGHGKKVNSNTHKRLDPCLLSINEQEYYILKY